MNWFPPEQPSEIYCLYTERQIQSAIRRMARSITRELSDSQPVILCVMLGGLVFAGQLLRHLHFPLTIDYLQVSRYHGTTEGSNLVWKTKPETDLKGRTVLILDDIFESGLTLKAIIDECLAQGAQSVHTAVLTEKVIERDPKGVQSVDFAGVIIPNVYVWGYGMDYGQFGRNANGIFSFSLPPGFIELQ